MFSVLRRGQSCKRLKDAAEVCLVIKPRASLISPHRHVLVAQDVAGFFDLFAVDIPDGAHAHLPFELTAEGVLTGRKPRLCMEMGYHAIQIINAIIEADRDSAMKTLDTKFEHPAPISSEYYGGASEERSLFLCSIFPLAASQQLCHVFGEAGVVIHADKVEI